MLILLKKVTLYLLKRHLCHCTRYHPIVESRKTFCVPLKRMAEDPNKTRLTFQGERTTWIIPVNLSELLELKANIPDALFIMGNTAGPSIKFRDEFHPVFISLLRLPELCFMHSTDDVRGAECGLALLNDGLHLIVWGQQKKTKTYCALLKHLRMLSRAQNKDMTLEGHVVNRPNFSDLNTILAAGNATINLISKVSPEFSDIPEKFMSALEDFLVITPQGIRMFQCVDPYRPSQDPINHPVIHQSAIKYAREAVFSVAQELFLAIVTSRRSHTNIISIDISEALALPGIVNVITAEDVAGNNKHQGEVLYAPNEVICRSQIICTVAADTYAHAREAAKKVKMTCEDIEPKIITKEQAFKYVDQIIDGEVHIEGQENFYMEMQTILAIPKEEDKEMALQLGTQFSSHVQVTGYFWKMRLQMTIGFINNGVIKAADPLMPAKFLWPIAKALEESINLLTTGYFKGYHTDMDWEKEEGDAYPHSVYGASCSDVEADCLTGAHKVLATESGASGPATSAHPRPANCPKY
ncbi:aldehyde oxidase isoform X2 [Prionailurus iriomotensis]